ncbi:MAG: hypothetical protein WBP81_06385, partial [Solirubrobacteraceae bacterium]
MSIGALLIVLGSSGGIDELATALDEMSAGWVLAALFAMLVGYLLLALHLRRLASGAISLWRAVRADLLLFGLGNWFNVRTLLGIGALAFLVAFARQHPGVHEAGCGGSARSSYCWCSPLRLGWQLGRPPPGARLE